MNKDLSPQHGTSLKVNLKQLNNQDQDVHKEILHDGQDDADLQEDDEELLEFQRAKGTPKFQLTRVDEDDKVVIEFDNFG